MKQLLQFTTWLAPGLPEDLFDTVASHVSAGLGYDHELSVEPKISGPVDHQHDRFATERTDVGFLCPPSFLWLTARRPPSIELVPLAPVHDDPRARGRPVYFSDIVVRADSEIESVDDLAGVRVGFNDRSSLSGCLSMLAMLRDHDRDPSFFGSFIGTGGHRISLDRIADGTLDAAAIDANVWRAWAAERGGGGVQLRSAATLGPFPVQPIVVRASLADDLLDPITAELRRSDLRDAVRSFGVTGFAPVTRADYEALRPLIALLPG